MQLVWFAQDEFRENSRYINHVTTRALLDGVVMSPHPENYRSRYADDLDESEYEYMWEDYENRLDHAEQHLRVFQTLDDLGESDLMIAQRAHSAPGTRNESGNRCPRRGLPFHSQPGPPYRDHTPFAGFRTP